MENLLLKPKKEVRQELILEIDLNSSGLSGLELCLLELQRNNGMNSVLFNTIYFCLCEACFLLSHPLKKNPPECNIKLNIMSCSREVVADLQIRALTASQRHLQAPTKEKTRALDNIRWLSDSYWVNDRTDKISLSFKIGS